MDVRAKAERGRSPALARGFIAATILAAAAVVAVAITRLESSSLRALALFTAGGIATELLHVRADRRAADPTSQNHSISFAAGVHLAAALALGPWPAAISAAVGTPFARPVRQASWRVTRFNTAVTVLVVCGAGFAFEGVAGHSGRLDLPGDWVALVACFLAFYAVNDSLLTLVLCLTSGGRFPRVLRDVLSTGGRGYPAECGFVTVLAVLALDSPWAVVALVPLAIAMYQGQARLAALHRETGRALETFANVIDERDDTTYHHSERVAGHVGGLARALGLGPAAVARLEWSARLHDLGKIAVDATILRKPGRLNEEEWAAIQRHPRLSARILRRFRFAAAEARAVEYHHERYDGQGYFGVAAGAIPLASHLLVVADSYDAMTSDRPYRRGLGRQEALAEIEANSGTQFHPAIAKAFVAFERGLDPLTALNDAERAELLTLARPESGGRRRELARLRRRLPEALLVAGSVAGLVAIGLASWPAALPGAVFALAGLTARTAERRRLSRLRSLLASSTTLDGVATALAGSGLLTWAGLVRWYAPAPAEQVIATWAGCTDEPDEGALVSWLLRETDTGVDVLRTEEAELGAGRVYLAALLARAGTPAAYLVLGFAGEPPRWLEGALLDARHRLEQGLDVRSPVERRTGLAAAS